MTESEHVLITIEKFCNLKPGMLFSNMRGNFVLLIKVNDLEFVTMEGKKIPEDCKTVRYESRNAFIHTFKKSKTEVHILYLATDTNFYSNYLQVLATEQCRSPFL